MVKTLTTICQFMHLLLIGLPLALVLYLTAHLFFELKILIKWIKN
jgi:hypothetical protein